MNGIRVCCESVVAVVVVSWRASGAAAVRVRDPLHAKFGLAPVLRSSTFCRRAAPESVLETQKVKMDACEACRDADDEPEPSSLVDLI